MTALNPELEKYLRQLLGNKLNDFLEALPEPSAIRVNTLKSEVAAVKEKLAAWGISFEDHPANPSGIILQDEPIALSHTLEHFLGEFYLQGVASQLPVLALNPQPGETVLDMAASPGSKSTQIAAMMQNTGRLVLNDPSIYRHRALTANTLKAGVLNDVTVRVPGQRLGNLFPEFFDKVLLDAPCSALGTFANRPDEINKWWSLSTLKKLTDIQYYLLVSAIKAAKPNGTIVYSTCSIAPEENELLIDRILKEYPVHIESITEFDGMNVREGRTDYLGQQLDSSLKNAVRTCPYSEPIEGFFLVKLRKTASLPMRPSDKTADFVPVNSSNEYITQDFLDKLRQKWGLNPQLLSDYNFIFTKRRVWIVKKDWREIPAQFLVKAGIILAEKGYGCWKLSHSSVQLLNEHLKHSFIELDSNQMQQLFRDGQIEYSNGLDDYYILRSENRNIALVSLFNNTLKINLPQRFNLVD